MRTLTATLAAAQLAASRKPYLRVQVFDKIAGVNRLAFTRHYTGAEPDGPSAAVATAAGTLIRARADAAGGNLFTQRIASPAAGSPWSTWPAASGTAHDVALATTGTTVTQIAVDAAGDLVVRESADDGATWSAWSTIVAAVGTGSRIAAAFASPTVLKVFYSVAGPDIASATRTAGVWAGDPPAGLSIASITGLAVVHPTGGDYTLAVAGTAATTTDPAVWSIICGDGYSYAAGTWGPLAEITIATSGAGVTFAWPSLWQPDVFRLTFLEAFTGTGAYTRPQLAHTTPTAEYADNRWREPYPFDLTQTVAHRLSITASPTTVWLSTPSGVWSAPLTTAALDVTARVIAAEIEDLPGLSHARIRLRNDDGAYNSPGTGQSLQLHVGAQVEIAPGYVTSAGGEVSAGGPDYWITGLAHDATGGRAELVIQAVNGWGLLNGWRARRQLAWAAGAATYAAVLAFVLARAGLEDATTGTLSNVISQQPAHTIQPGTSAGDAARAMLQILPEIALWKGATLSLRQAASSESPAYAYGGAGNHPILAGVYRTTEAPTNVARVTGPALQIGESFDFSELARSLDRLDLVHNPNLATSALLAEQAAGMVRKAAMHVDAGYLVATLNCGLELYDVVTLTESRAGLSSAKRRVIGLVTTWDARRKLYEQRLALGNV